MHKILNILFLGALLCFSLTAFSQKGNPNEVYRKSGKDIPALRPSEQKLAQTKKLYGKTLISSIKKKTKDLQIVDAKGRVNGPDMVKFLQILNEEVKTYPNLSDARRFEHQVSRAAFANACPEEFAKTLNGNRWLGLIAFSSDGFSKTYKMYELTNIFYNLNPSSPENGYITVTYKDKTQQKFDVKGVLVKK
uniref:Uncharacterized protein n=1 Tax=uncultured Elusimicrobia bacterium TaxID=699876 RepID=A0A650ELY7_9BACT|nr:hypothetical protein Elusimicrob2101_0030 [uncultured Elusimicrobia bacterium]